MTYGLRGYDQESFERQLEREEIIGEEKLDNERSKATDETPDPSHPDS